MCCTGCRFYLEGGEPHEPVQAVVVRRHEARPPVHVPGLTHELVLFPHRSRVLGIRAQSALENHLSALLSDAAEERERREQWVLLICCTTNTVKRCHCIVSPGVPAEGPVGVNDAQRVEGRVHHLPGTQQVHHHGQAQVANQNGQRDVHRPANQHA